VTALEALKILEDAVLECKRRSVDTPEAREALDLLEPHIRPEWLVPQFRAHLYGGQQDWDKEGQQQVLRATFPGIRDGVRCLLGKHMDKLARRYSDSHNPEVKAALERLSVERGKLNEPWIFRELSIVVH
jgi:hypothetical protein